MATPGRRLIGQRGVSRRDRRDCRPVAVLTEFHAHLEARGWASTQIKESRSLAFRVKRGRTTVLVLFSKDEQNRLVISAMRG